MGYRNEQCPTDFDGVMNNTIGDAAHPIQYDTVEIDLSEVRGQVINHDYTALKEEQNPRVTLPRVEDEKSPSASFSLVTTILETILQ